MSDTQLATSPRLENRYSARDEPAGSHRRIKVLSIAHSAFGDGSSRLRYYPLAVDKSLDLTVLIPNQWQEGGQKFAIGSDAGPLNIRVGAVCLQSIPKLNWYGHFYPGLGRLLRELNPDVLHLWEEPWSIVALHATLLRDRHFPNLALVLETDQNILRRLPPPFETICRFTLKHTDLLIARAEEALNVSRASGYEGPHQFVEYVIPTHLFKPTDREAARKEFGFNEFTIGYVGRFVPEKGLSCVLDSLKACNSSVNFAMMGSGPALESIKKQIANLDLGNRVRIFAPQSQERVAPFMRALDALVLMSETQRTWKEQFGRVIVEAQACGTPVIGSDSGSIPYVVGSGGWIVPERDSGGLAMLLDRLVANPELRETQAQRAALNIERFTPEIVGGNLKKAMLEASRSRRLRMRA